MTSFRPVSKMEWKRTHTHKKFKNSLGVDIASIQTTTEKWKKQKKKKKKYKNCEK